MKRLAVLTLALLLAVLAYGQEKPQKKKAPPSSDPLAPFSYDPGWPLDLKVLATRKAGGAELREVDFESPVKGRVSATFVLPDAAGRAGKTGKAPAVVFMHWGQGNSSEFVGEALLLARAGVASALVDAPFARTSPWRYGTEDPAKPEASRALFVGNIVDLRRTVDVLCAMPEVDHDRIAFVGHSFGATWGGSLAAADRRIKACVLMAGLPTLTDLTLTGARRYDEYLAMIQKNLPKETWESYVSQVGPISSASLIGRAKGTAFLFQFAEYDSFISRKAADAYVAAAPEPKTVKWYPCSHEFADPRALQDRLDWLGGQLGFAPPSACEAKPAPAAAPTVAPAGAPFPDLSGPYLGQKPPGPKPEIFAPGVVSTGMYTRDMAMTPDGKELYFSVVQGGNEYATILATRLGPDGLWTRPEVCAFAGDPRYKTIEPCISPDGRRFFFVSNRPKAQGSGTAGSYDIWVMDREGEAWGAPRNVGAPVNTDADEYFPSVTRWDTLYYTRENPDGTNSIYRSVWKDGRYQAPDKLPAQVNCGADRFNAFVSPDESYVILPAVGVKDSLGGVDYYVAFRNADDTWSGPFNLGPGVNTKGSQEYSPYVSRDGMYFFFMSSRVREGALPPGGALSAAGLRAMHDAPGHGTPAVWWVDAAFIEGLRPSASAKAPRK